MAPLVLPVPLPVLLAGERLAEVPITMATTAMAITTTAAMMMAIRGPRRLGGATRLGDSDIGCLRGAVERRRQRRRRSMVPPDARPRAECCAPPSHSVAVRHAISVRRVLSAGGSTG